MNDTTFIDSAGDCVELAHEERQRCEVWTRVMGYHRPVASFNIGKKGEHYERRFFQERAQWGTDHDFSERAQWGTDHDFSDAHAIESVKKNVVCPRFPRET